MLPEITKIETWSGGGYFGVSARLSTELLPGCGYLMLTHFKWTYWLFHGFDHVFFDRTIDRQHGLSVNKRLWQFADVDREWFRRKDCWIPLLKWVDEHARHSTITARWFTLQFHCRPWLGSPADAAGAAEQLRALVDRIRQSRSG